MAIDLPLDLILEILRRLPIKQLCQLKTLSPEIRSRIETDQVFISKTRSKIFSQFSVFDVYENFSVVSIDHSGVSRKLLEISDIRDGKTCRGLICCRNASMVDDTKLFLINPTKKHAIMLPDWGSSFEVGFDVNSGKFKLLGWKDSKGHLDFEVLTLNTWRKNCEWKPLENDLDIGSLPQIGVHNDTHMFWLDSENKCIISFEMSSGMFGRVVFPSGMSYNAEFFRYYLLIFVGKLCLVEQLLRKTDFDDLVIKKVWLLKTADNSFWIEFFDEIALPVGAEVVNENGYIMSGNGEVMAVCYNAKEVFGFPYCFLSRQFRAIQIFGDCTTHMSKIDFYVESNYDLEKILMKLPKRSRRES